MPLRATVYFPEQPPAYEQAIQDDFASASLPESQGFAGKTYGVFWEILGGALEHHGHRPLPTLAAWTTAEMADVHAALAVISPDAFLYAGARHRYLGLSVLTVGVQVGATLAGRDRFESQSQDASGFIDYACEGAPNTLPALMGPARRLMQGLAAEALAEVLATLQQQETRRA